MTLIHDRLVNLKHKTRTSFNALQHVPLLFSFSLSINHVKIIKCLKNYKINAKENHEFIKWLPAKHRRLIWPESLLDCAS